MPPQFRRASPKRQTDVAAITAWLRMGELQAARLNLADYSAARLQAAIPALRAASLLPAEQVGPELVRLCAQAGVALVFVPALYAAWFRIGRKPHHHIDQTGGLVAEPEPQS